MSINKKLRNTMAIEIRDGEVYEIRPRNKIIFGFFEAPYKDTCTKIEPKKINDSETSKKRKAKDKDAK